MCSEEWLWSVNNTIQHCFAIVILSVTRFRDCKPSRTLLPILSLGPGDPNIWHRYCISCTGYQYWIRQCILFKTAVLVYKCRHGMAPSYLSTYCMPTSSHDSRCHLRSVPCTTTNYGDRSFAVSGPTVWNSLPAALRLDMSLSVFRTWLKTFLMT